MNREDARYAAVQAQIEQIARDGANDRDPATAILRAQLIAEMYTKNERSHQRAIEAWTSIIQSLEIAIQRRRPGLELISAAREEREVAERAKAIWQDNDYA